MNIPQIDLPVYEALARKDESMGLIYTFFVTPNGNDTFTEYRVIRYEETLAQALYFQNIDGYKIIGHEILLSDVLNFFWKRYMEVEIDYKNIEENVLKVWDLSLPYYSQQSEECKSFIRSLI